MAAGRKSKYYTHVEPYLALVKSMRVDGFKEEQIFRKLGVGHTAFNEYKRDHTELAEALKYSKDTLIARLEQTLYQKALEGNMTAVIFSLKNLAPNKWADKKVIETTALDEFFKSMSKFEQSIK